MAITSVGYGKINANPGQIDAAQWAKITETLGADYGVVGDSWKATPLTTAPRSVSISAGTGYGRGITDVSDSLATVQAAALGTGVTVRYDTVVARRDWSAPATTFATVTGTSSPVIAASRATTPGQLDEQPLYIIKLDSSTPVPTIVADLRKWNGKVSSVNDLRAVVDPDIGDTVVDLSANVTYRYILSNGNLVRVRVGSNTVFTRSGTDIDGIAAADAQSPLNTVEVHGIWHGFTTVSGRSELSPVLSYGINLTAVFDVQITQIHRGTASIAPNGIAEYASSTAGLQVVYPNVVASGNSSQTERAFRWHVTGVL